MTSSSFPSELVLPQSLNFAIDGSPYRTRSRRHELNDNNNHNKESRDDDNDVSASDNQESDVDAQNVDKANNNNMKTGFMQSFFTRNVVAGQTENSSHHHENIVNTHYDEDQYHTNNHIDNDNTGESATTTSMLSFGKPSAALANLISQVEYNHDNETSSDEDDDEDGSTCSNGFYQEEVEQHQEEHTDTSSPSRQRQNSHRSPSPTATRRHHYNHQSSTPAAVAFTPQAVFVSTVKKSREAEQQDADDVEEEKRIHATRDLNKLLEEKVSAASLKQQKSNNNNNNFLPQLAQWIMISQDQADEQQQQQQHNHNHGNSRRMSSMMDFKSKSFRPGHSQVDASFNASATSTSSAHHQHQRFRGLKDRKEGMLNCLNDLISFSESAGQNVGKRNKENKKSIKNRYQTCTVDSSEKKKTTVRVEAVKSLSVFFGL